MKKQYFPPHSTQKALKTDEKDIPFYCHPDETKEDPFQAHIIRGFTYQRIKGVFANIILDVGTNIGAASVFFALNYPGANIFSFEPITKNLNLLIMFLLKKPIGKKKQFTN